MKILKEFCDNFVIILKFRVNGKLGTQNLEWTASQKTDNANARGACAYKHSYSKFHNAALKYFHAVFISHNAALTLIQHLYSIIAALM